MGGYGALLAAERAPDRFQAVVAASPALWTSPGATPAIAFDGANDYHRNDVFAGVDRLTVRIDCGTDDPFVDADRQFADQLPRPHHGTFGPGFHDAAYWRSVAPAQITTIAVSLQYTPGDIGAHWVARRVRGGKAGAFVTSTLRTRRIGIDPRR